MIRGIISSFYPDTLSQYGLSLSSGHMLVFFSLWYLFTLVTYGVWIPSGLFLPGMIIGCALGGLYNTLHVSWFGLTAASYSVTPILLGAGAMLAGYIQLTYSLVVIMMETTDSFNLFIPFMITITTSRAIGKLCTRSLYERAIRTKQMPLLRESAPEETRRLHADVLMSRSLCTLMSVTDMASVKAALMSSHNSFPVLNTAGNLVGILPRGILVVLAEEKCFYDREKIGAKQVEEREEEEQTQPTAIVDELLMRANESAKLNESFVSDHDSLRAGFP